MRIALFVLLASAGMFAAPFCSARADDAPAQVGLFIDYWNAGDQRAERNLKVFTEDFVARRGEAGLARIMNMIYGDNGDIAVHSLTTIEPERVVFLVTSDEGNWLNVELGLSEDGRIAGFGVSFTTAPALEEDKGLSDEQIAEKIGAFVDELAKNKEFSGSVLVAKGFEPMFARAWGMADYSAKRPNTLDTPINLGSMNKMFTGLAVTQLVAQGKLAWDDTVGKHLPEYPDEQVRNEVTIHHLLTHTSGLGSYWNPGYEAIKNELSSVSDFVSAFEGQPLAFNPGQGNQYSNVGPTVLGLIIETVTGEDYFDYVREHIYGPAGMSRSDHYDKFETLSGKASGYSVEGGELVINSEWIGRIGGPAGGGYASANDLLSFAQALYDGTLIDESHREIMTSFKVPWGENGGYGYLYGDHRENGQRYVGHNGGAPGINAEFSHFPDLGYTVIVLSNFGDAATPVAEEIRAWVAYSAEADSS